MAEAASTADKAMATLASTVGEAVAMSASTADEAVAKAASTDDEGAAVEDAVIMLTSTMDRGRICVHDGPVCGQGRVHGRRGVHSG